MFVAGFLAELGTQKQMFSLVVNSMRAFSFEQDSFIGESLWEEEGVAKYLPGGL